MRMMIWDPQSFRTGMRAMSSWTLWLGLFATIVTIGASASCIFPASELSALHSFYNATKGTHWQLSGAAAPWNFTQPDPNPCEDQWYGISCQTDGQSCYVISIIMSSAINLDGSIPSLSNLTYLEALNLQNNVGLTGSIPSSLCTNTHLVELILSSNSLSGTIPSCFTALETLEISYNGGITGTIPAAFCGLPLVLFQAANNSLSGTIPSCTWPNLLALQLSYNNITGTIPPTLCNANGTLSTLMLNNNHLQGIIPACLTVNTLELQSNLLTGTLPATLFAAGTAVSVFVADNALTGTLPDLRPSASSLASFSVGNNFLHGTLPSSLCNMSHLFVFSVDFNRFTGSLPNCSHLSDRWTPPPLESTLLESNVFTGTIPRWLCTPTTEDFLVNNNQLTATLDTCALRFHRLNRASFSVNYFTGHLPASLATCPNVSVLLFASNGFSGSFPVSYAEHGLIELFVEDNLLSGSLPPNVVYPGVVVVPVSYLNLSSNRFTGRIPSSYLSDIRDFSFNRFTGPLNVLPNVSLVELFVEGNALTGPVGAIPASSLAKLRYLVAANNFFRGPLPAIFFEAAPALVSLDLSVNCFTGRLPSAVCSGGDGGGVDGDGDTSATTTTTLWPSNLTTLVFDGLHTATRCRQNVWPATATAGPSSTTTTTTTGGTAIYVTTQGVHGRIPTCLFTRYPRLQTLHLSGNALTGPLPSPPTLPSSLQYLSLSYNKLSGTIPLIIQQMPFTVLDLSSNRLQGTLSPTMTRAYATPGTQLRLFDNRLSGTIPAVLQEAVDLSVLTGNMFTCDTQRDALPTADAASHAYSCGSTSTDTAVAVWCIVTSVVLALVGAIAWSQQQRRRHQPARGTMTHAKLPVAVGKVTSAVALSRRLVVQLVTAAWSTAAPPTAAGGGGGPAGDGDGDGDGDAVDDLTLTEDEALDIAMADEAPLSEAERITAVETITTMTTGRLTSGKELTVTFSSIVRFQRMQWRRLGWILRCTALLTVAGLVVYGALSMSSSTFTFSYIWVISVAFKAGIVPAVVYLLWYGTWLIVWFTRVWPWLSLVTLADAAGVPVDRSTHPRRPSPPQQQQQQQQQQQPPQQPRSFHLATIHDAIHASSRLVALDLAIAVVVAVNVVVVMAVNVAYIRAVTVNNAIGAWQKLLLSLAVSLFKIVWGKVFDAVCFTCLAHCEPPSPSPSPSPSTSLPPVARTAPIAPTTTTTAAATATATFTATAAAMAMSPRREMVTAVIYWVSLFNNLLSLIVANAVFNSSCFYYSFYAAPPVTYAYPTISCQVAPHVQWQSSSSFTLVLESCATNTLSTSAYQPPFTYSYMCSSALMPTYVPVLVFRCLLSCVVFPAWHRLGGVVLRDSLYRWGCDSVVFRTLFRVLPNYVRIRHLLQHATLFDHLSSCQRAELVRRDQAVLAAHVDYVESATLIAILVVFGSLFPVVAGIAGISLVIRYVNHIHTMNYMIYAWLRLPMSTEVVASTRPTGDETATRVDPPTATMPSEDVTSTTWPTRVLQRLNVDAVEALTLWSHPRRDVVGIFAVTWSLFVFDVLGDAVGGIDAAWVVPVVLGAPLVLVAWPSCVALLTNAAAAAAASSWRSTRRETAGVPPSSTTSPSPAAVELTAQAVRGGVEEGDEEGDEEEEGGAASHINNPLHQHRPAVC